MPLAGGDWSPCQGGVAVDRGGPEHRHPCSFGFVIAHRSCIGCHACTVDWTVGGPTRLPLNHFYRRDPPARAWWRRWLVGRPSPSS